MIRTWPIDESLEGERCDVALSRLTGESRATCVTLLEEKRVTLNGIGFNMKEKEDLTLEGLSFDVLHSLDINEFNKTGT